ncbi:MAG: UDP-3-O-(3-hydroxymyristoyl)glucosamine N-acyltransferase [Prevotella sp.]|nr:UDP-3-O-(3-hydroxymyristoyl)glucosamine N-acyltransferase [Bacteroides sp.]MCM1365820.1 UDP-3-O-(3-hydroxymyristoyl)glucosamine N-acyltransferase [Prevotella sp.]MCM1436488.1 UDP-3-O-(3-hydroxymyristoyl)glucosamine N-acyltransferase [Prevotella sp.]
MEITVKDIASIIGGKVDGDSFSKLSGFAPIQSAQKGHLTFLSNPKYTPYIYSTEATAVLVADTFQTTEPVNTTLIRVKNPYDALASLMNMVQSLKAKPVGVEPQSFISDDVALPEGLYVGAFAYIGRGVNLGRNVKIYPQAYIADGCTIGDDTIIRAGVKIYEDCTIGRNCIIHSGAVIGADGFGFAPTAGGYDKIPQIGNVIIEDNVEIGANTCIDRATFGHTVIGKGTKLDNLIQVAHNVSIGSNNVFASQSGVAGSTSIGDWNRVGGQVGFAGHISIGNFNEFGAQSGIPKSVGDNKRLIGYPAVNARDFARNQVYIKKIAELFETRK